LLKDISSEIFSGAPLYIIQAIGGEDQGIPLINIRDIHDERLVPSELSLIKAESIRKPERFMVFPGDVVITCRGTRLKIAAVPDELEKAFITANLIAVRPSQEMNPIFLAAYLRSPEGQKALLENVTSSTMQLVLNVSAISKISVPVPPIYFQNKLAALIQAMEESRRLHQEEADLCRRMTEQVIQDLTAQKR
jgi:restriction endonuclease S subunit